MPASRVQIPVEIAADVVVFDVRPRGYDQRQVNAHVAALEQTVAELRWGYDELAGQRLELARERADFEAERQRWRPSFTDLGAAAEQILALADSEATALLAAATETARQRREDSDTELRALNRELADQQEQGRLQIAAELGQLERAAADRRQILDRELAHARRDAELTATGLVARASAQAQELVRRAKDEARDLLAAAHATLAETARDRDRLGAELVELAGRLNAVVARLAGPGR